MMDTNMMNTGMMNMLNTDMMTMTDTGMTIKI